MIVLLGMLLLLIGAYVSENYDGIFYTIIGYILCSASILLMMYPLLEEVITCLVLV